jgi:hypothetical protein
MLSFKKYNDPLHMMGIGQRKLISDKLEEMGITDYVINDDFSVDIKEIKMYYVSADKCPNDIKFNCVVSDKRNIFGTDYYCLIP